MTRQAFPHSVNIIMPCLARVPQFRPENTLNIQGQKTKWIKNLSSYINLYHIRTGSGRSQKSISLHICIDSHTYRKQVWLLWFRTSNFYFQFTYRADPVLSLGSAMREIRSIASIIPGAVGGKQSSKTKNSVSSGSTGGSKSCVACKKGLEGFAIETSIGSSVA